MKALAAVLFVAALWAVSALEPASVYAQTGANPVACGESIHPEKFYERSSLVALAAGFALLLLGILVDKNALKAGLLGLAVLPFAAWVYIHFFIDYAGLKRLAFTYNAQAENTLANIAEAQDRYKSEHDTFLTDLEKLRSHTAGAHGTDPCVKILKIEAEWNHWYAEAQHVSSPDKVRWDSRSGSSLKKG
jgi:hypothetical protein